MADGISGYVEGQIEADDRRAKLIGMSEQEFVSELGDRHKGVALGEREPPDDGELSLRDGLRIVENALIPKLPVFTQLIAPEKKGLAMVFRRFSVEYENPTARAGV